MRLTLLIVVVCHSIVISKQGAGRTSKASVVHPRRRPYILSPRHSSASWPKPILRRGLRTNSEDKRLRRVSTSWYQAKSEPLTVVFAVPFIAFMTGVPSAVHDGPTTFRVSAPRFHGPHSQRPPPPTAAPDCLTAARLAVSIPNGDETAQGTHRLEMSLADSVIPGMKEEGFVATETCRTAARENEQVTACQT